MTATDTARLSQEHLDFLWPTLRNRGDVKLAIQTCGELDNPRLGHLLRKHDHNIATVWAPGEIDLRESFDHALQSWSLLTVALIAGYVPSDLGATPTQELSSFLGREPVRQYYEKYYPLMLPCLLRLHVGKQTFLPQESSELAWGSFQWLMRFSGRFEKNQNLGMFLSLLDGFRYGSLDINSFLDSLTDPATALAGIVKPPDLLNRQESAVLGMLRYLTFCRELAPALEAMQGAPLTQSACWFYYAYWFKEFAGASDRVEACLNILSQWLNSSAIGVNAAREGEKQVAETRSALVALIDGRFGAPLVNWLKSKQR